MGQRNTPYNNSHMMTDLEADQRGQIHPYGNVTAFPQPNVHSLLPVRVSGNAGNGFLHPLPEHHNNTLFYGMTQYNRTIPQHPAANLDPALATSSNHHDPYMAAPSATRDFLIPVNHGTHDQFSFSSNHGMVGIQTASHGISNPYVDGVRGSFKIKSAEGIHQNLHYHHAMVGSSSSVAPVIARAHESDASLMNATPMLPDHGDSSSAIEDVSQRSVRNGPLVSGPDSVAAQGTNHFVHGNYAGAFQLRGNPWSDMQFNNNTGEGETWSWNQAVHLPYMHGSMAGPIETGNMGGIQGYQVRGGNGSLTSFMHPPIPLGHSNVHHHPQSVQGMRGHNINFPPMMAASSSRHSTNPPLSSNINPFPGVVETGTSYMGAFVPAGVRLYRPLRRGFMVETNNVWHRNIPNLRFMPEDGVTMLEIPGYYNGIGDSADQHSDMRMDIDHMSYEELLALGEQIGSVTTGLSEEFITSHLKTKPFTSSKTSPVSKGAECSDQNTDFCVICQNDYKDQESIGTVECGHAYHVDCIKKWLVVKNSCPICKSTAMPTEQKDL
ncbi:PREDICTED: uncharacterized protein LOC109188383 [Ipomoea nil]|uniref:uncharacterized protein LOC109188383 n=1 Tax=Ipomoea nil TaxID=35883 RepID=UPI0009010E9F|nr:PREDICTED: uncharacterized protein LOC109188383 [Ipomoea nil]